MNDKSVLTIAKEAMSIAASSLVVLGSVVTLIVWLAGGLKPQTQAVAEVINGKLSEVQTDIAAMKAKLDAMPRPSDYAAHEAHLSKLDGRMDELSNRMTSDEVNAASLKARVDRLEAGSAPIRIPRQ